MEPADGEQVLALASAGHERTSLGVLGGQVRSGSVRFDRIVNLVRIGQVHAELVRTCLNLPEPVHNSIPNFVQP